MAEVKVEDEVKVADELTDAKRAILTSLANNPDATDTDISDIATESLPGDESVSRGYVSKIKSEDPDLVNKYVTELATEEEQDDSEPDSTEAVAEDEEDESASEDESTSYVERPFESLSDKQKAIVDTIARHRFTSDSRVEQTASDLLPGEMTVSRAYVSMARSDFPNLIESRDRQIEQNPESTQLEFDESEAGSDDGTHSDQADPDPDSDSDQHLKSKSDYHDLTDKMRAIVDAIAEEPDAGDTRVAEIATEKLPTDMKVSRAYVPQVRESQDSIIDSRIETQANKRDFEGTSKTTGDPFSETSLSASPDQEDLQASTETASGASESGGGNSVDQLDSLDTDDGGYQMISERPVQGSQQTTNSEADSDVEVASDESGPEAQSAQSTISADTASSTSNTGAVTADTQTESESEPEPEPERVDESLSPADTPDSALSLEIELQRGDVESLLVGQVPDDVRENLVGELVTKAFN